MPAGGSGNFLLSATVSAVFANAGGNNFYPAVNSALIDAGAVAQTVAFDFNGLTRPNPPTVGAYVSDTIVACITAVNAMFTGRIIFTLTALFANFRIF
jgi:hypothetical protein